MFESELIVYMHILSLQTKIIAASSTVTQIESWPPDR